MTTEAVYVDLSMAAQEEKQSDLKYDFSFAASLNNKVVELTCTDSVSNKKWTVSYDENNSNYSDIDAEFLKMKDAIEGGNADIKPPDNDNGPLIVKAGDYTFELKQF